MHAQAQSLAEGGQTRKVCREGWGLQTPASVLAPCSGSTSVSSRQRVSFLSIGTVCRLFLGHWCLGSWQGPSRSFPDRLRELRPQESKIQMGTLNRSPETCWAERKARASVVLPVSVGPGWGDTECLGTAALSRALDGHSPVDPPCRHVGRTGSSQLSMGGN